MSEIDKEKAVEVLNRTPESELAEVVRNANYSFPVFGLGRIPIVASLRHQADESLEAERVAFDLYRDLLALTEHRSVAPERSRRRPEFEENPSC